jgi:hypothetical protein
MQQQQQQLQQHVQQSAWLQHICAVANRSAKDLLGVCVGGFRLVLVLETGM